MADRSNAGERILGARRTTTGKQDALENLVGDGIHDGAQCYVIEEQATYRFVADSQLPADGKYVVAAIRRGRFVRESGLVGFALLERGTIDDAEGEPWFRRQVTAYKDTQLVQFERTDHGDVRYIGTVSRLAMLFASGELRFANGTAELFIELPGRVPAATTVLAGGYVSCSGAALLYPGDTVGLAARAKYRVAGSGSLRVVLT